jgi:hypothetical protein
MNKKFQIYDSEIYESIIPTKPTAFALLGRPPRKVARNLRIHIRPSFNLLKPSGNMT